ncbi:hypothetical protein B0H67DRAFT_482384 [Lasiosphaeris hirsuta]|uniref:Uncharacterized protein n=1 Tax=Lasiosphaeris hirsuta TaxID=260670 RepID=A0AA40E4V2_9PEZI|nr:hypothetical protein B0H67DRAFT_482384 [Lasiosphaeris hirsuta]
MLLFGISLALALAVYSFYRSRTCGRHHNGRPAEKRQSKRLETKKQERLESFKSMYHKVQNLELFPDVLPEARHLLLSLLEQGLLMTRYKPHAHSILDINEFDADRLRKFIEDKQAHVGREFESYVRRREAGAGQDLFTSFEGARQFLKNSAPWNYTDGAWLARVHKITTPFALRGVTKNAWQILSEELGDGDLAKNHVALYRDLLRSVGVDLPPGNAADFIHPRHGLEDESIWRYSIGQLLVSVFPNDFLPEILGFNLFYEQPHLGVLKANKELPEFGVSPYYYVLHISIDNADSGHCAMAVGNIASFMRVVQETGLMDPASAWKRVQAGYCLGLSLDDKETIHDYEDELVGLLRRKAGVASKIHCTSRARIGGRSLSAWLSSDDQGKKEEEDDDDDDAFLTALANSKPWVYRGNSSKSLLMRELSWRGRMFGAFTHRETELMRTWIDSLGPKDGAAPAEERYWNLVGGFATVEKIFSPPRRDAAVTHPAFPPEMPPWPPTTEPVLRHFTPRPPMILAQAPGAATAGRLGILIPLWFAHPCLLENTVSSPHQTITPLFSKCLRLLRAENGFAPEGTGIACMDEQLRPPRYSPDIVDLGLAMVRRHALPEPTCLGDVLGPPDAEDLGDAVRFAHALLSWAQRPMRNVAFLLGLARAFLDLEAWVAGDEALLAREQRDALRLMVDRKAVVLDECVDELQADELKLREFAGGYERGRAELDRLLG